MKEYTLPSGAIVIKNIAVLDTENATELMETNDRTMAGANNWTDVDMATFDATTDLSVTNDAANQSCYLDDSDIVEEGHIYRLDYDCTLTSGTFELRMYTSGTKLGDFADGDSNVIEFRAPEDGELAIVATATAGQADFDNFSLKERSKDKYRPARKIIGDINQVWLDHETKG